MCLCVFMCLYVPTPPRGRGGGGELQVREGYVYVLEALVDQAVVLAEDEGTGVRKRRLARKAAAAFLHRVEPASAHVRYTSLSQEDWGRIRGGKHNEWLRDEPHVAGARHNPRRLKKDTQELKPPFLHPIAHNIYQLPMNKVH